MLYRNQKCTQTTHIKKSGSQKVIFYLALLGIVISNPAAATYLWCGWPNLPQQTRQYEFIIDEVSRTVRGPRGNIYDVSVFSDMEIIFYQHGILVQRPTLRWQTDQECRAVSSRGDDAISNLYHQNHRLFQRCSEISSSRTVPGRMKFSINRMTGEFNVDDEAAVSGGFRVVSSVIRGLCRAPSRRF